jgi:hypothetical protein
MSSQAVNWGDTIGQALGAWSAVEIAKQNARLAETQRQAAIYGIPAQSSNPQANAASYTAGSWADKARRNPLLTVAGLAVIGLVLWRVSK